MTPAAVHFGQATATQRSRAAVLAAAYRAHPERFKGKHPTPPALPEIVGINLPQPKPTQTADDLTISTLHTNFSTKVSQSHRHIPKPDKHLEADSSIGASRRLRSPLKLVMP